MNSTAVSIDTEDIYIIAFTMLSNLSIAYDGHEYASLISQEYSLTTMYKV